MKTTVSVTFREDLEWGKGIQDILYVCCLNLLQFIYLCIFVELKTNTIIKNKR